LNQHSYGKCVECGNQILEEEGGYCMSDDTGAKAHTWCAQASKTRDEYGFDVPEYLPGATL
jgi:hypothetical protein